MAKRPGQEAAEQNYELWLYTLFFPILSYGSRLVGMADHHRDLWEWVVGMVRGIRAIPLVAIWARGGAKSTMAELAAVFLGATRRRLYIVYVCGTQDRADDHVGSIAQLLTSPRFAEWYPDCADRDMTKFGSVRGWRRNRLVTASGFAIDAMGLDTAIRGVRLTDETGSRRPDLIIVDDIDGPHDTAMIVERRLEVLSRSIIPALSPDGTVLFVQNIVHRGSVAARFATTEADDPLYTDILADRMVLGPIPALHGVYRELHDCAELEHEVCALQGEYEVRGIHRGIHLCSERHPDRLCDRAGREAWVVNDDVTPTWEGQGLDECESLIALIGLDAFMAESQHDVGLTGNLVFMPPFHPARNAWLRTLPPFVAVFGGLDFGGQRPDAHFSGGLVAGLTSANRLIRVGEFHDRGPRVIDKQIEWMRAMEHKHARALRQRIHWRGDGSQSAVVGVMQGLNIVAGNPRSAHFDVEPSDRSAGSVSYRIGLVNRRLAVQASGEPDSYYVPSLVPKWAKQVQEVAFKPMEPGTANVPREPIKRNDDLCDPDLYLHEALDHFKRPNQRSGVAGRQRVRREPDAWNGNPARERAAV